MKQKYTERRLQMLLEIVENKFVVDKNPYIQDVKLNLDVLAKLLRLKLKYITPEGLEPVDLAMSYDVPKVSVSSVSISVKFSGKERIRNISFQEELSFSLLKQSFHLRGNFGKKQIDQKINKASDILDIIRSELTTINDK